MIDSTDSWLWGQRVFCASRNCVLHVTAQAPGVRGSGQWAEVGGILYDRHSMGDAGGPLFCGACRTVLLAEHEAGLVRAAEAEARAAAARARAEPKEQAELFAASEQSDNSCAAAGASGAEDRAHA